MRKKKYPMVFTLSKVQFGKYYVEFMLKITWNAYLSIDWPFEWFHKLDFGFLMCSRFAIEWVGLLNYEVIVVLAFGFISALLSIWLIDNVHWVIFLVASLNNQPKIPQINQWFFMRPPFASIDFLFLFWVSFGHLGYIN